MTWDKVAWDKGVGFKVDDVKSGRWFKVDDVKKCKVDDVEKKWTMLG